MRICVAPDKFKGSLSARDAAAAMASGLARRLPQATIDQIPVADGGDGTAQTLVDSLGGTMVEREVCAPHGSRVKAHYGLLDTHVAVIELAQASGLALVPAGRNDPRSATTRGTGELIDAAIARGVKRIILAIGGSATNDGGAGALSALGAVFKDQNGQTLPPGGAALADLCAIETGELERKLEGVRIEIACDVRNSLCGPAGASAVYGPQKGASPHDVAVLDGALGRFADVLARTAGQDVRNVPGAGAAGGVGAGFMALAHATLRPGAELVLEILDFRKRLAGVHLVVTGEGRLDRQTLQGKAPFAVAQAARAAGVPAAAIAGSIECTLQELETAGIDVALSITTKPMTLEEASQRAWELVARAAETLARSLTLKLA